MEFTIENIRKFCDENPGKFAAWEEMLEDLQFAEYTLSDFDEEAEIQAAEQGISYRTCIKLAEFFPGQFSWEEDE